jgi:hypothetical protein
MRKMSLSVAPYTECDQVFFSVSTERASKADMVNLKIARISTSLASPSVTFEHSLAKPPIGVRVQSNPRSSLDG